jgi:hypothetical protein
MIPIIAATPDSMISKNRRAAAPQCDTQLNDKQDFVHMCTFKFIKWLLSLKAIRDRALYVINPFFRTPDFPSLYIEKSF